MPVACAYPLLHQQYACETLPASEIAFAWHGTHDAPAAPENVLIGHKTHAVDPDTSANDPAVQLTHTVAPAPSEYDPALQFAHGVADVVGVGILLYLIMTMPEPPLPPTSSP
jgi:hypothetical protein